MLKTGENAPSFSALNQAGKTINSADYVGHYNMVLYFYPKDDTPGCTIEANDFTALIGEFSDCDTVVFGVSKDDCESHQAFIAKFDLEVGLLADTEGALCEQYGVWQEKEKNGVKKMGIARSTFVIDKEGQLRDVRYGVSAEGHASEILGVVRSLSTDEDEVEGIGDEG